MGIITPPPPGITGADGVVVVVGVVVIGSATQSNYMNHQRRIARD